MTQQFITNILPEGIVDIAQVIQIEHDQGKPLFLSMALYDVRFKLLLKIVAVGQVSKWVKAGLIANGMDGFA
ncbi:hypothetical protein KUV32_06185 [Pseudidiomarina sediminum]|nr:hypothetical protein [Pseudidiomarina sediminum]MBY6063889.1 hypothetical protein [Pseudidiomarina sediminum]